MNVKEFLKPDWPKIILFLILGVILFFTDWWWIPECCDFFYYQGLPLPVYQSGGFPGLPKTFIPVNFVIDVLIWYFVSIVVVFGINKLRRKPSV